MSRRKRKERRAALREQARGRGEEQRANDGEKRAPAKAWKPPSSLTPKRLRFAILWAEADPEDSLEEIARAAGYSESVSKNGYVAGLCRDPAIREVRDHRLAELQQASRVTVEDTLIGLQLLAKDPLVPARDRVGALKTILAWYAKDKGQHAPASPAEKRPSAGMADELARSLALHLGIPVEATTE